MTVQSSDLNRSLARLRASALPFKTRLAERIEDLEAAFAEDYDGRPSAKSIDGLIDFLEASPPSGYPDLTLTPAGDCYAEWRGPRGKVAIEFLASGAARYFLLRPNARHPARTDHLIGTTTVDALADTIALVAPFAASGA